MPRKLPTYRVKRYGWIRDLPDHRDLMYAAPIVSAETLPPKVDLRETNLLPAPYDQGQLGSCTANAIAAAVQFARREEQRLPDFVPSRLFIYYNERVIENSVTHDAGAQIRDGVKSVAKVGVCPETSTPAAPYDWPYDIALFAEKPPDPCYTFAAQSLITSYSKILPGDDAAPRLPRVGIPVRVRLHRLRELRVAAGGADRGREPARRERERRRRPRRPGGRLRRQRPALHRPKLVGDLVGAGWLLHHALRLPHRREPRLGFLDGAPGGVAEEAAGHSTATATLNRRAGSPPPNGRA